MKITKFLTFATALGMLFTSCNKDEVDVFTPGGNVETESALLTLYVTNEVSTRGISEEENDLQTAGSVAESAINKLEIFVYDENSQVIDAYESYEGTELSGDNLYHVNVNVPVDAGQANKKVLVFTNRTFNLGNIATINYDDLKKALYNQPISTPTAVSENIGIPMAGESAATAVLNANKSVVVKIARLYARFNAPDTSDTTVSLTDEAKEDLAELLDVDVDNIGNVNFDLSGYYVINGLNKSFMYPNYGALELAGAGAGANDRWNSTVWTIGNNVENNYISTTYDDNGEMTSSYSGNTYLLDTPVYLYENSPYYEDGVGFDSRSIYSFIIKGELEVEVTGEANQTITRYWRLNVSKWSNMADYLKVLRNSIYEVKINNITTIGEGSAEEAENPEPPVPGLEDAILDVTVDVLPWRFFQEETDM